MQQQRSKTPLIPPQTGFAKILHSLIIISLFLMIGSIIPVLVLTIVSGLAMYQPAQLHWLLSLFINWQILRTVHFFDGANFLNSWIVSCSHGASSRGSEINPIDVLSLDNSWNSCVFCSS